MMPQSRWHNWTRLLPSKRVHENRGGLSVTEASVKQPKVAIASTTLANGLHVVIAPDSAAPVVTVGVYYKIGFRLEPQGRSGFAHLFEHMMFQGSANAPKMQHIKLINSSG